MHGRPVFERERHSREGYADLCRRQSPFVPLRFTPCDWRRTFQEPREKGTGTLAAQSGHVDSSSAGDKSQILLSF